LRTCRNIRQAGGKNGEHMIAISIKYPKKKPDLQSASTDLIGKKNNFSSAA